MPVDITSPRRESHIKTPLWLANVRLVLLLIVLVVVSYRNFLNRVGNGTLSSTPFLTNSQVSQGLGMIENRNGINGQSREDDPPKTGAKGVHLKEKVAQVVNVHLAKGTEIERFKRECKHA